MRYTYLRLFSDEAGESHFESSEMDLAATDFAPPAPPLFLSTALPAQQMSFLGAPADWDGRAWHPAPHRQVFITLAGTYEITASDGTVRTFPPGAVVLLDDTTGKGHSTRVISAEDVSIAVVRLATTAA